MCRRADWWGPLGRSPRLPGGSADRWSGRGASPQPALPVRTLQLHGSPAADSGVRAAEVWEAAWSVLLCHGCKSNCVSTPCGLGICNYPLSDLVFRTTDGPCSSPSHAVISERDPMASLWKVEPARGRGSQGLWGHTGWLGTGGGCVLEPRREFPAWRPSFPRVVHRNSVSRSPCGRHSPVPTPQTTGSGMDPAAMFSHVRRGHGAEFAELAEAAGSLWGAAHLGTQGPRPAPRRGAGGGSGWACVVDVRVLVPHARGGHLSCRAEVGLRPLLPCL